MITLQDFFPTMTRFVAEGARGADDAGLISPPPGQPHRSLPLAALVVGVGALRRRNDQLERVRAIDLYLPSQLSAVPELFSLEPTLEQTMAGPNQPECLRCHDLRPVAFGGGPYRAVQEERDPDFHGFSFGNTIELAITGLNRTLIGVEPDSYTIGAFARPLLWLDYGPGDAHNQLVLYVESDGSLRVFVGRPPESS